MIAAQKHWTLVWCPAVGKVPGHGMVLDPERDLVRQNVCLGVDVTVSSVLYDNGCEKDT